MFLSACLAVIISAAPGMIQAAPQDGAGEVKVPSSAPPPPHLSPMNLSADGPENPAELYEIWRMENAVSLPVPPPVLEAYREWLWRRGAFGGDASLSELQTPDSTLPAAGVGTNVCPAGGVSDYQGEVTLAVNPNNPSQLVAAANTFYPDPAAPCQAPSGTTYGTIALFGSSDGGATWTYNCAPWPPTDTGSVGTVMFGSDPTTAWDTANNAYAAYMLVSENTAGTRVSSSIVVAKSPNAGLTWSPLGIVVNHLGTTTVFDDKDMMAIDTTAGQAHSHTNRIYVIWDENNVERVAYSDNGSTWTTVVVDASGGDIGGDLAVGPDGTVYAVWNRYSTTGGVGLGDKLMFASSQDGGASWSAPSQVVTHNLASFGTNNKPPAQDKRAVNAFPSIAVDSGPTSPSRGALYIVYSDFPPTVGSGTDLNAYLIRSGNGGASWSAQAKINDDASTATQFFPWVDVDPSSGIVVASWYDTRNDTADRRTQIYFSLSCDGGSSFSPNVQVTQTSSQFNNSTVSTSDENSADNTKYNPNQYGDYAQIAASGGKAWPVWTDSRQFYPAFTTSVLVEDVATAALTIGTIPGPPQNLSASATGAAQVTLTWTSGAPPGNSFSVLRAGGLCPASAYSPLVSGLSVPGYVDTSVLPDQTYAYAVGAVDSVSGCPGALSGCAQVTVPNDSIKPVPDGFWNPGTPLKALKAAPAGTSISLTWDITTCIDPNYNLYYGYGSQIGIYALSGGQCGIGTTGTYAWTGAPSIPPAEHYIWWVIVGESGVATEGSWGRNSSGVERHPAASGLCGCLAKSTAATCP